jgi:hypothetical protein
MISRKKTGGGYILVESLVTGGTNGVFLSFFICHKGGNAGKGPNCGYLSARFFFQQR